VLALLYDIHGNLPALEAVLEDARKAGAERFVLGGDYALFGAWPAETVERLRELPADWIRGNGERWTAHVHDAPENDVVRGAIEECAAQLGDRTVAELDVLPETLADDGVRFCHASPISDVRSFLPEPGPDEAELLNGVREPLLVFGHTHLPFARDAVGGAPRLVNPGSVGMPFDGDPRAAWAILHDDGRVEHRRVAYDHEAAAADVRAFGGRWSQTVARRIEQARIEV
jgi:diadenosine tetraphosphatase ApaH/serine/threonine PP2A family protein phosphatase